MAGESLEQEAFNRCTYGMLVVSDDGKVIRANLQAARLVEASGLPPAGLTCCALLGCRRPGTPLAGTCLTQMVISRNGPLPEIRIDLATPAGERAIWVAAAPLADDASRVVLQLRPGVIRDRRRHSDPQWTAEPRLRIRTLGKTTVEPSAAAAGGDWLDKRTGQVLKYLITNRHRTVSVDEIGERIWPDADFTVAASVRYQIHQVRRKLEPQRGNREQPRLIRSHPAGYSLDSTQIEFDVEQFERLIQADVCDTNPELATKQIEQGLALYHGDFLAELPYAEWAIPERERLHDLACDALRKLADIYSARAERARTTRCLKRLAAMQPYDEHVHRQLIELDIRHGSHSDAIRRYAALRRRMNQAFGHDPAFTPADLATLRG